MLLGEYLHALATKAGMNPDDDVLKNFLMHGELVKIEIPEEITKGIDSKLISIADAKNNHPEIKPHYTQQSLMTIDKTIEKLLEELGLDDNLRAEVLSETSTYKRVPKLVEKVRELEISKAAASKGDKAQIQAQIDELHAKIRTEKDRADKAEQSFKDELRNYKINNKRQSLFGAYKTIYDDLDPEVKATTINALLLKRLQEDNADITFDENENLVLLKKDGTNFYDTDNNKQVNPQQYIEQLLSKSKILKTAPTPTVQGNPPAPVPNPIVVNGNQPKGSPALKELLTAAQADFAKGSSNGVNY